MKKPVKTIDKQLVLVRSKIRTLNGPELQQIAGGNEQCKPGRSYDSG
jgi:hypothetical protein